jgi:hypothetical protein
MTNLLHEGTLVLYRNSKNVVWLLVVSVSNYFPYLLSVNEVGALSGVDNLHRGGLQSTVGTWYSSQS